MLIIQISILRMNLWKKYFEIPKHVNNSEVEVIAF